MFLGASAGFSYGRDGDVNIYPYENGSWVILFHHKCSQTAGLGYSAYDVLHACGGQ